MTARPLVMIVDDERLLVESLSELLSDDFEVAAAGTVADAAARITQAPPVDVVLCDVHLRDGTGLDLHRACAAAVPGLERRIVFFTGGNLSSALAAQVKTTGCPCLEKPFDFDKLVALLQRIAAG
jgi:DNA-binding NtrC family response regulator